jgi:hypothetical protein
MSMSETTQSDPFKPIEKIVQYLINNDFKTKDIPRQHAFFESKFLPFTPEHRDCLLHYTDSNLSMSIQRWFPLYKMIKAQNELCKTWSNSLMIALIDIQERHCYVMDWISYVHMFVESSDAQNIMKKSFIDKFLVYLLPEEDNKKFNYLFTVTKKEDRSKTTTEKSKRIREDGTSDIDERNRTKISNIGDTKGNNTKIN